MALSPKDNENKQTTTTIKQDLIKLETSAQQRKPQQNEKQLMKREKTFANYVVDKGLISKTHKQLIQLNITKKEQPNEKMGRRSK